MTNSSKTKILYIGPIPPEVGGKSAGGVATHAWQLATQAAKRGYEVYVLTNAGSSFTKDSVKVISTLQRNKLLKAFYGLNFWLTSNKGELSNLIFLSFKEKVSVLYGAYLLQEIINSVKPDLIHVHSLHNLHSLSLKLLQLSIPIVITDHEFYPGDQKGKDIEIANQALSTANYLICTSEYTKGRLEEFDLNYLGKIKVIHNPINSDRLPLLRKEEVKQELGLAKKKVILFSGVYKPIEKKGLDILLKAFSIDRYLSQTCRLIVKSNEVGGSWAKRFMEREGKTVDGMILGLMPWDRMVKYYNAADIFVMPSRSEGFGIVYTEALLAGTPVIGFNRTLSELEGLLCIYIGEKFDASREDEKDLAEKIIKVLNTNFDREFLRRKVVDKLSWDEKFSEFNSTYREVLA